MASKIDNYGTKRSILFYTGQRDGVTFNPKITPQLSKTECDERRWLSNF